MFCTKCGTAVTGARNFCGHCGNPISAAGAATAKPVTPQAPAAPVAHLIDQLPSRLEKVLSELLEPNERIQIKLKGAFKEALVCTDKRVLILKAGFMTGQTFGSNVFQSPYRTITGVQVKKHLITGYFELSAGGVQNRPTSYWQSGQGAPERRENCVSLNSSAAFPKFREASTFILSRCG
ncbi:MAG: PH domain-containing protein [Candidatus Binatus sp.]|jgi:hypothetical protein|uniref:PH domain-containing protein n=1 Tax=Candidatus Binatus sp. TaxID=2811406 RepID=UPI003D1185FD